MRHFQKLAMMFGIVASVVLPAVSAYAQGGTPSVEPPHKVAVVDVARILKEHAGIVAQRNQIEKELKDFEALVTQKQKDLRAAVEQLKTLEAGTPDYARQEEKIAEEDKNLRLEMNRKRKDLVEAEARVYYENYQMIADAVRRVAEHNKIDLVIRYSGEEMSLEDKESVIRGVMKNVVYHSNRMDLTPIVMQVLDQLMVAKRSAGSTVK